LHVKNALDRENKCRLYHRGFAVAFAQFGQVSRFMSSEFGKGPVGGDSEETIFQTDEWLTNRVDP
jgi:hypothetical protein